MREMLTMALLLRHALAVSRSKRLVVSLLVFLALFSFALFFSLAVDQYVEGEGDPWREGEYRAVRAAEREEELHARHTCDTEHIVQRARLISLYLLCLVFRSPLVRPPPSLVLLPTLDQLLVPSSPSLVLHTWCSALMTPQSTAAR